MAKRIISVIFGLIIVLAFASPGWAPPPPKPEIDVLGNGTSIPSGATTPNAGDDTLFEDAFVGGAVDHVFTIRNDGAADLNILGSVTVDDTTNFSVQVQPGTPIAPSGSTTFTIRFNPQSAATFTATVTIPNDDQNEGTYTFLVQGTGLAGSPVINVYGLGTLITNGANTPNAGDDTLFEDPGIGGNVDHIFTIENTGDADLTVGSVTVDDPTNFSIHTQPGSPVPSGSGTTTFTVRFNPQSGGTFPATVSIPNNDSDQNPYTFAIEGTATVAAPTVDTPSVGNVQVTTADLGGNIASTGGENATERGVYWSTTPGFTPPGQGTKVSETPGPYGIGTFTLNNVPGLNPGALNYFRAFATNSAGTGYSTEQAFQTEPASQPTGLVFSSITSSSMTISWTQQSGDGSIVVVKQGGPVDVDPADFNVYGFSSDPWNGGTDLGGGNYVVYRGAGMSVNINGLSAANTYGVAIYAYAGSGGTNPDGVNYQQDGPLTGSQGTPAGKPTLSAPSIVGFADATSATIGATIEADGGDSVTDFGTVWGTASQPTGNSASAGSTPGAFPYSYSHLRDTPAMPSGKLIYFRGYASNSFDTGYSPDGIFYTEPNAQADGVTFSNVSFGSFTIDWSPGDRTDGYDGSIVIIKKDSAVDALPQDGNTYTADSVFESGTELGTGNYVVYSGPGTTVTVTGLWHNRTYYVAVYEYSGSGSSINYMLVEASNRGSQTTTKAPSHRKAYQIDCGQCHASHSVFGGSYVPRGQDQEDLCKTCHVPGGQAANKAEVSNHVVAGMTTDCGSCHEVHNADTQASPQNILWTYDFHNNITAENLNWIRGNPGTSEDPPYVPGAAPAEPIVFHSASNAEFARADTETNAGGYLDGLCQACHSNPAIDTKYHTNDPSGTNNPAPTDPTYGYTHPANKPDWQGGNCLECHPHSGGFAPQVSATQSCLIECHQPSSTDGSQNRLYNRTNSGFNLTSMHVGPNPTQDDCKVCHMEPDSNHTDGKVDLRDPDTGNAISVNFDVLGGTTPLTRDASTNVLEANIVAVQNEFCFKCHDTDGASGSFNAVEGTLKDGNHPFSTDNLVPNIWDQFDPANEQHHAVRAPAANDHATATAANGNFTTMEAPWNQSGNHDQITCFDCHMRDDTNGGQIGAHGGNFQRMLLDDINVDGLEAATDKASATAANTQATVDAFCTRCHQFAVYLDNRNPETVGSAFAWHGKGQSGHSSNNDASCFGCHGGIGDMGATHYNGAARGNIHGRSFTWPATTNFPETQNQPTEHFMVGGFITEYFADTVGSQIFCAGGTCNHAGGRNEARY